MSSKANRFADSQKGPVNLKTGSLGQVDLDNDFMLG